MKAQRLAVAVVVAALAAVVGLLVWVVMPMALPMALPMAPLPSAEQPRAVEAAKQPAGAQAQAEPTTAKLPAKAADPVRAVPQPVTQPPAQVRQEVWDLCGVGRVPAPPAALSAAAGATASTPSAQAQDLWSALPPHLGDQALADALENLVQRLDAGSPRWRAAAAMLRGEDPAGGPAAPALRLLAQQAGDPVIAMWALQWCGRSKTCTDADTQRWLTLEPGNLAPWLEWLQHEPQAVDKGLQAMAQAQRFQSYQTALSQVVLQALPQDVPAYLLPQVWAYAIGIEAALGMPGFKPLTDTCRAGLLPDSDLARACAAIAKTLVEHSDSITPASIGLRLAERTYMSPAQAAAQRAALNALLRVDSGEPDLSASLSCSTVAAFRTMVEQRAQLGELGALRARAAASAASAASAAASAPA